MNYFIGKFIMKIYWVVHVRTYSQFHLSACSTQCLPSNPCVSVEFSTANIGLGT